MRSGFRERRFVERGNTNETGMKSEPRSANTSRVRSESANVQPMHFAFRVVQRVLFG